MVNAMSIAKVRGLIALALCVCRLAAGMTALAFGHRAGPKVESRTEETKQAGPREAVAVHRFEGHTDGVMVVAFSPDGKRTPSGGVCYGDRDPTVRLWDVATGKEVLKL